MTRGRLQQASVAWVLFWGAIALDSAMTYRRSVEAVERAEEADPYLEMYDGPPPQDGRVTRGLFWQSPTLVRLRQLARRTAWWKDKAPWIALAGPPVFFALWRRLRGPKPA